MLKFAFSNKLKIKKFINQKSLTILNIIKANSKIFTQELLKKTKNKGIRLKKSQLYRYLDCLELYELIIKYDWKVCQDGIGYSYDITLEGRKILKIFSDILKVKK